MPQMSPLDWIFLPAITLFLAMSLITLLWWIQFPKFLFNPLKLSQSSTENFISHMTQL